MQEMTSEAELKAFVNQDQAVWLFKHSEACGTSYYAMNEYQSYLADNPDDVAGVIIIQSHRDLSNLAADLLDVIHKSPQLFLVQGGKVLWHTSHMGITATAMQKAKQDA